MTPQPFILASTSAARRAMLTEAGVPFVAMSPQVDEDAIKLSLRAAGHDARAQADALAEAKAVKLSRRHPGALVLGADQILATDDGCTLDKPGSIVDASDQLRQLRGRRHRLISAAVIAENGIAVWRLVETATLEMRAFSESFLADYVAREGDALLTTVGGYRLEGLGAQLFSRISGDYFTILGLPLLGVLDYLRVRGVLTS